MWKLMLALGVAVYAADGINEEPPTYRCVNRALYEQGEEPQADSRCTTPATSVGTCLATTPRRASFGCRRYLFFDQCLLNWDDAQEVCEARGGKLWEPLNIQEYNGVFSDINYSAGPPIQPAWLTATNGFHWWIGLVNGDNDGVRARYSSTNALVPWKNLDEAQLNQDCVDIFGNRDLWGDHQCSLQLKFICQLEDCCFCNYESRIYPTNTLITAVPHCCAYVICDFQASVRNVYLTDSATGRNLTDCCLYQGFLTLPNSHTTDQKRFCCDGNLIQTVP